MAKSPKPYCNILVNVSLVKFATEVQIFLVNIVLVNTAKSQNLSQQSFSQHSKISKTLLQQFSQRSSKKGVV